MSEIITIIKGLYPAFLCLALLGCAIRVKEQRWRRFDTITLLFLLVFIAGVILQPIIFYGELATSRRYLIIIVPLYFGWSTEGLCYILNKLKRYSGFLPYLWCVLMVIFCYEISSPIIKRYTSSKKSLEREAILVISDYIKEDWSSQNKLPTELIKCDFYQSGRLPLVQCDFDQIGYLSGGQYFQSIFIDNGFNADYIVTNDETQLDGYNLVKGVCIKGRNFNVWRRYDKSY